MAFCSKCGTQNDNALKFCTNCGTPTAPQPQPMQAQQPMQQSQPYAQPQYQQPYAPAPAAPAPAKKKSKAPLVIVALVLVAGLAATGIFTKGFGLFGGKSVPVSGITGFNATLGGQAVKMGAKLTAGSCLATGGETNVYLEVGKNSIVKMDENSEISVAEIKGGVLKFDLVRGSVLINENGKSGRVQMTAGNNRVVVRGTFFTAKYDGSDMTVDLIAGEIGVTTDSGETTSVEQGNRVTVWGDGEAEVDALDVSKFDNFTKGSVMEYKSDLARGTLSEADFSYIEDTWSGNKSETDSPAYNDALIGDWGETGGGGGSDGGEDTTANVWADFGEGGGSDGGGGEGGGSGGESDGGSGDGGGSDGGGGAGGGNLVPIPEDWIGPG